MELLHINGHICSGFIRWHTRFVYHLIGVIMSLDFFYLLTFFSLMGSKWEKNSISYNMDKFNFQSDFDGFCQIIPNEICNQNNTTSLVLRIMRVYNGVSYVSRTLLCPTHYCIQQNTVSTLTLMIICSPFTFQCDVVVSCCVYKAS